MIMTVDGTDGDEPCFDSGMECSLLVGRRFIVQRFGYPIEISFFLRIARISSDEVRRFSCRDGPCTRFTVKLITEA